MNGYVQCCIMTSWSSLRHDFMTDRQSQYLALVLVKSFFVVFWRFKMVRTFGNDSSTLILFYPTGNYMFTVNNRKTRCRICSKLTIKTPERRNWNRPGVFIVNSEHISHLALLFLLLTLSR